VPGARGGYVRVTDAIKRALPQEAPYPAGVVITGAADDGAAAGAAPAGEE
jgi:large subunit ribosomal protein L3